MSATASPRLNFANAYVSAGLSRASRSRSAALRAGLASALEMSDGVATGALAQADSAMAARQLAISRRMANSRGRIGRILQRPAADVRGETLPTAFPTDPAKHRAGCGLPKGCLASVIRPAEPPAMRLF